MHYCRIGTAMIEVDWLKVNRRRLVQGAASNWAAHAVRQEPAFAEAFDAISATEACRPVLFTGENVFPWMLEVRVLVFCNNNNQFHGNQVDTLAAVLIGP